MWGFPILKSCILASRPDSSVWLLTNQRRMNVELTSKVQQGFEFWEDGCQQIAKIDQGYDVEFDVERILEGLENVVLKCHILHEIKRDPIFITLLPSSWVKDTAESKLLGGSLLGFIGMELSSMYREL